MPFEFGGFASIGDPDNIGTAPGLTGEVTVIRIPAALPLLGSALAGFGFICWRRRKAA